MLSQLPILIFLSLTHYRTLVRYYFTISNGRCYTYAVAARLEEAELRCGETILAQFSIEGKAKFHMRHLRSFLPSSAVFELIIHARATPLPSLNCKTAVTASDHRSVRPSELNATGPEAARRQYKSDLRTTAFTPAMRRFLSSLTH